MPKITDSLDDWVISDYEEQGQSFLVASKKGVTYDKSLAEEGPYEKLDRNGRYLIPINYAYGSNFAFFTKKEMLDRQHRELNFKNDDVIIAAYPRAGCTWMEQIVLLVMHRGDPNALDTKTKNTYDPKANPPRNGKVLFETMFAEKSDVDMAAPWGSLCGQDMGLTKEDIESIPFRRLFKVHYRPHSLPGMSKAPEHGENFVKAPVDVDGVKIILLLRDPKDVALSLIRVNSINLQKGGVPLTPFLKTFLDGKLYSNDWNTYYQEWLDIVNQHPDKFLVIAYEDNITDSVGTIERVAKFLGMDLTEEEKESCRKYSAFGAMKEMSKNSKAEHVHVGKVGAWRDIYTKEVVEAFNEKLRDEKLGSYAERYIVNDFEEKWKVCFGKITYGPLLQVAKII